jgi:hypothetical protein
MEAPGGLEPPIEILQTSALPLGDGALLKNCEDRKNGAGEGVRTLDFNLGKVALYHWVTPAYIFVWDGLPETNYISSTEIVKFYFLKNFVSVPSIKRRMLP